MHLEGNDPAHGGRDRLLHGTCAFIRLDGFGNPPQHGQNVGASARGGVSHGHRRRGQPGMLPEPRTPQHFIHQPDHGADNFRRGEIGAGQFAQRVIIDLQEVLVEIEPRFGPALADGRPMNGVEHARECSERGLERGLVLRVVGEEPERRADQ